jgi:hypothetical protein
MQHLTTIALIDVAKTFSIFHDALLQVTNMVSD